jgi:hypothetical protein
LYRKPCLVYRKLAITAANRGCIRSPASPSAARAPRAATPPLHR